MLVLLLQPVVCLSEHFCTKFSLRIFSIDSIQKSSKRFRISQNTLTNSIDQILFYSSDKNVLFLSLPVQILFPSVKSCLRLLSDYFFFSFLYTSMVLIFSISVVALFHLNGGYKSMSFDPECGAESNSLLIFLYLQYKAFHNLSHCPCTLLCISLVKLCKGGACVIFPQFYLDVIAVQYYIRWASPLAQLQRVHWQCRRRTDMGLIPESGRSPGGLNGTLVFLLGKSHGQRSLQVTVSVQFSRSVVSDSLRPHESQHARPPCPSPTPGVHSDSRPSSQ